MTPRPYDLLPKAAQQRIAQGLQALVDCKERELTILRQMTAITQAVMAHPESPEKWPLRAPWPEGFVVLRADGWFLCLDRSMRPVAWTSALSEAHIWTQRESAAYAVHARFDSVCTVLRVEEACAKVAE